jgi:hypothetical protein
MRFATMLALMAPFALTSIGCRDEAAKPAAPPPANAIAAKPAAPAALPKAVVPAKPAHPATVEVELMGRVAVAPKLLGKPPKQILLYVSDKDCLDPASRFFTIRPVGEDGAFFTEIFPPWGTDLSLCAALDADGKPARVYGKLDRTLRAEGFGEVVFSELEIALAKGAPRPFPKRPW